MDILAAATRHRTAPARAQEAWKDVSFDDAFTDTPDFVLADTAA